MPKDNLLRHCWNHQDQSRAARDLWRYELLVPTLSLRAERVDESDRLECQHGSTFGKSPP